MECTGIFVFCRDFEYEDAERRTNTEWLDLLLQGGDEKISITSVQTVSFHIQGHSGGAKVGPTLLDNEQIPYKWSEYLYHVGCSLYMRSITQSGLIAGGTDAKEGS